MTTPRDVTELRVLGPLEARIGAEPVSLGGAKQRAVLAVLLLREGEVVSVERLIEEVWGDDPPPSAAHTLESYVSRLRQLFNGAGPTILRRGAGYTFELGTGELDARTFVELHEQAGLAAAEQDHERVVRLTSAALAVWRGPALADVVLASAGRAEAERLEELRLRAYELEFDAQLALGRHERVVGEVQALVSQNPYRERFVAQLMLALYRSGRHAEALEVYERLRASLDGDLGLQPSADLQRLSGQIVRQDLELGLTPRVSRARIPAHPVGARVLRLPRLVAAGLVAAAVMALSAGAGTSGTGVPSEHPTGRIAIVIPKAPEHAGVHPASVRDITGAVEGLRFRWGFTTTTFVTGSEQTENARWGDFDLAVVLAETTEARRLAAVVRDEPDTHFVFLDSSLDELSLKGASNVTAVRFAEEESSHLVGYLSGLVQLLGRPANARADVVSVVGGIPAARARRAINGFVRGVRRSRPGIRVLVDYSGELDDPTRCEQIANTQISAGSDVVFAFAGPCGKGALAVAKLRDVWGVGSVEDGFVPRSNVLAVTVKDWWALVSWVLDTHGLGELAPGEVVRGLDDDYAVVVGVNSFVDERLWSKVVERCSEIRRQSASHASESRKGILDD